VAGATNRTGLCAKEELSLYCHENLYGPLETKDESMFYLSVVNPSHLDLPEYPWYNVTAFQGYAFGVIDKTTLGLQYNSARGVDECTQDNRLTKVNLGKHVESV
jgi:hypothetical protein